MNICSSTLFVTLSDDGLGLNWCSTKQFLTLQLQNLCFRSKVNAGDLLTLILVMNVTVQLTMSVQGSLVPGKVLEIRPF